MSGVSLKIPKKCSIVPSKRAAPSEPAAPKQKEHYANRHAIRDSVSDNDRPGHRPIGVHPRRFPTHCSRSICHLPFAIPVRRHVLRSLGAGGSHPCPTGALFPPSLNSQPSTRPSRRTGKIARLPLEIRNFVNQSLRQGWTYPDIIHHLESLGHPGLKPSNLSAWYQGGSQDWLRAQEAFEARQVRPELIQALAGQLAHDGKSTLVDLNHQLLAYGLQQALADFDFQSLRTILAAKPAEFFRLAHLVNAQSAVQPQRDFVQLAVQRDRDKKRPKQQKARGLTPEIPAEMERKAKIL